MDLGDQNLKDHPYYWIFFLPNIIPLFELSIVRYPSPLDVASSVDNTAPLFLIAGLVDYCCVLMLGHLLVLVLRADEASVLALLFTLASAFRAWRFGFLALRRACWIDWTNWAEVKRVNYLLLLINPALLWHAGLLFLFGSTGAEESRTWMKNVLWVLLVRGVELGRKKKDIADTDNGVSQSWMSGTLSTWIRIPLESVVNTLLGVLLKFLPTVVLVLLAGLPTLLRALQKVFKKVSSLQQTSRIISALNYVDSFAIRMRSEILRASVRWATDLYNAIQARLPWQQRSPLTPRKGTHPRIRLLKVTPAIYGFQEIHCSLKLVELGEENAPCSYTAISYHWGDFTEKKTIILDGERVDVSDSAYQALQGLRPYWRYEYFWIDQLCIKQDDMSDKEQQIPLMADIYKQSSRLIIWLGAAEEGWLAVNVVHRVWVWSRLRASNGLEPNVVVSSQVAREALIKLLLHPWFSRTWVVQEIVMGARMDWGDKATIVYGGASLSWKRFAWFAMTVLRSRKIVKELTDNDEALSSTCLLVSQHVTTVAGFGWINGRIKPAPLLFYLTRMFRVGRFDATVAKDRIYAVLSLCQFATDPAFAPDYSKKDSDLFIEAAKHCLESAPPQRKLEFLGHAGLAYNNSTLGLPSWVPDWTVTPATSPLPGLDGTADLVTADSPIHDSFSWHIAQLYGYAEFSWVHANQRPIFMAAQAALNAKTTAMEKILYRATEDRAAETRFLPGNRLEIRGRRFDRLKLVGKAMQSEQNLSKAGDSLSFGAAVVQWSLLAQLNAYSSPYSYFLQNAWPRAFYRTLCGDLSGDWTDLVDTQAPERPIPYNILAGVSRYLAKINALVELGMKVEDLSSGEEPAEAELFDRIERCIRNLCTGRMFGVTEKGYYGLFLSGSKPGDLVCLFDGVRVPLCVREVDEDGEQARYKLVGACYVHGIMDGEVLLPSRDSERFILV
jgi:hypothetical protein